MTRRQILKASWSYDGHKWSGFDGVEHWTVERDESDGSWLVGHSGKLLEYVRAKARSGKVREVRRERRFPTEWSALAAAENAADELHNQQKRERDAKRGNHGSRF